MSSVFQAGSDMFGEGEVIWLSLEVELRLKRRNFLEGDMSERDKCFIGSHVPQAPIRGAYSI